MLRSRLAQTDTLLACVRQDATGALQILLRVQVHGGNKHNNSGEDINGMPEAAGGQQHMQQHMQQQMTIMARRSSRRECVENCSILRCDWSNTRSRVCFK